MAPAPVLRPVSPGAMLQSPALSVRISASPPGAVRAENFLPLLQIETAGCRGKPMCLPEPKPSGVRNIISISVGLLPTKRADTWACTAFGVSAPTYTLISSWKPELLLLPPSGHFAALNFYLLHSYFLLPHQSRKQRTEKPVALALLGSL